MIRFQSDTGLRIAVGDRVWFNGSQFIVETLGMRYAHLRSGDGTLVQFCKLSACHKLGSGSLLDTLQQPCGDGRFSLADFKKQNR